MPAPTLQKAEILERLSDTFRRLGYDGASVGDIAEATGLGKSSLYHYFPGGKQEMAAAVLSHLAESLEQQLFAPLGAAGAPARKLGRMLEALHAFYDGGRRACLLARLAASAHGPQLRRPLSDVFVRWIEAITELCREAGLPPGEARSRAEDAVVRVEGALVLTAATGDPGPFERTLSSIRGTLLVRSSRASRV